ncbi:nuclear pore glycoprotein p62-like [Setaria italica]|uniref:nuclear pore glycoprotein p62-like n=1 Tax=Setaria italica TaxID=4555 RepID=UPI000350A3A2|nr:nuclear pore glycoprotein p62-like [Setaria italica]
MGVLAASEIRAAPRGLVPQLAPKKVLQVLSAFAGRTAAPPMASGGVTGETAGPTEEVAPVAATGVVALQPGTGQSLNPAPPSASSTDPVVQNIAPGGPQAGEGIDLNTDKAEEMAVVETRAVAPAAVTGMKAVTEEGESTPAATAGTEMAGEAGTTAPVAVSKEAAVMGVGTSTRGAAAKVAATAEAEVPTPEAMTGGEAATGTLAPAPTSEVVAPMGGLGLELASAVSAAASTGVGVRAPGPSVRPATSGTAMPTLTAASGSAPALASTTPIPKVWSGSVLCWSSRDDPHKPLFTLDDATEWGKWQALQGGLANVRAALSSALGELDGVVFPGGWALQECSRGKSDFLRLEQWL